MSTNSVTAVSLLYNWKQKFSYLELDVRSLSLFRIVLGISVLYNLIFVKWDFVIVFIGKNRLIPQSVLSKMNGKNSFSIFDYIQNDTFAYLFLIAGIIAAFLYTIGYYTRIFSWLTLFFYWNITQAISSYGFGFDFYTFQLLFWSCFLPLDNFFAVTQKEQVVMPRFSVSFVLLFQIICVYFFTGIAKYGISWKGGYAIHNMLMDNWATLPAASFLIDKPYLYKPLTYCTLFIDCSFPFLLLLPSPKSVFRYIIVIFLIMFHLSILLMYVVGNFSITGFAAAAVLIPADFWNRFYKTKNKIIFQPLKKQVNYLLISFCIFAIYIITVKNLIFSTKYTVVKNFQSVEIIKKGLNAIDIPSPVKVSFFLQHWKMFAPNPPSKLGWLALEIKKEDGYYYDFITNQLITDVPTVYWYPKGYEALLIKYSRNYIFTPTGDKYKIFLKYWIPYKIKQINPNADYKSIVFADYTFLSTDQSVPHIPPLKKVVIPVDSMINLIKNQGAPGE